LDIFYSYRGLPLKWHYPIGLLYDLLSDGSAEMLPWGIAVHFYDPFPVQTIIRMLTHDSPRETFMATVKQADYIRCGGSSRSYMAMLSKSDQSRLWDGLWSDNFERFWQANSKLLQQQRQAFNIPLRIYQTPLIDSAMNWPPPIQELVSSTRTDGKETTVGDLLESVTPVEKRPAAAAAVLHGVEIPLETPLCWLSENCAYADGFLHVVLR
jgi:autophagy-related protein 5